MPLYRIAGLTWDSDFPFTFPLDDREPAPPPIRLMRAPEGERFTSPDSPPAGQYIYRGRPIFRSYQLEDGSFLLGLRHIDFLIASDARSVVWYSDPDTPVDMVRTLLASLVASFVRMVRGTITLHASAVVSEGAALCFVGLSGAGKSTLAAGLSRLGTVEVIAVEHREQAALDLLLGLPQLGQVAVYLPALAQPQKQPHVEGQVRG